jgi:hypothetical protein
MRRLHHITSILLVVGVSALVGVDTRARPGVPGTPPPIVRAASRAYAVQVRGIIGMQRHFTTRVSGGPVQHGETSTSGQLMENGQFVRIVYYNIVRDGRPFSAAQIAQRNTKRTRTGLKARSFSRSHTIRAT